jgi:Protein of unknown function (DUF2934)
MDRDKNLDKTLEQRIRERAYELWITTGRHDGQADQHWLMAERELLAKLMAEATPPAPPQPSAAKPAASRKPRSRATPTVAKAAARAVAH